MDRERLLRMAISGDREAPCAALNLPEDMHISCDVWESGDSGGVLFGVSARTNTDWPSPVQLLGRGRVPHDRLAQQQMVGWVRSNLHAITCAQLFFGMAVRKLIPADRREEIKARLVSARHADTGDLHLDAYVIDTGVPGWQGMHSRQPRIEIPTRYSYDAPRASDLIAEQIIIQKFPGSTG